MASLFRISSVIYRIVLLVILVLYLRDLLEDDDKLAILHLSLEGVAFLSFITLPLIFFTLYLNIRTEFHKTKSIFRLCSICFVLISLLFTLKLLSDLLFPIAYFERSDLFAFIVVLLFWLISASVLHGLLKKKV